MLIRIRDVQAADGEDSVWRAYWPGALLPVGLIKLEIDMRDLSRVELQEVGGGNVATELLGAGGSGYAATAATYGRGVAIVAGMAAFGIPGAIGAGMAFTAGWAIGVGINYFSSSSSGGGKPTPSMIHMAF